MYFFMEKFWSLGGADNSVEFQPSGGNSSQVRDKSVALCM